MITYRTDAGETRIIDCDWITPGEERQLLTDAGPRSARKLRRTLATLTTQEAAWIAAATPRQWGIGWGDYFRHDFGGNGIQAPATIYGQVRPLFDVIDAEQAAGATTGEIDSIITRIREGYTRGWRPVRAWSRITPEGETGDTHVAVMTPLTPAQFEMARTSGWPE